MATTNIYLNFPGNTEEAFLFYQSVFGGEFTGGIHRFGQMPAMENMPPLDETTKNMVMHMEINLPGGLRLMGTDAPTSMGMSVNMGNNVYISLHPDSREEADMLFAKLSPDAKIQSPMRDEFWGAYYGSLTDKFGVQWMINFEVSQ